MTTIYVDNIAYQVSDGDNLLHACLSLGFNLPYFCWHPALHSVGACRQCAVKQFKDETDTRGRIVMACMTQVAEGMRISIADPDAAGFRAGVIEWLMQSHPHDCPVCDEGGECHLQDMTQMTGHNYRRYRFKKRTHRNQYLGPFINHEMNRCIQCYRCVRYYRDYAGGQDLNVFGVHNNVYFGRAQEGVLESEFAGNLVEVCPTGVFTDKPFGQHSTRKWDLETAPSICVHCSVGCNTIPGARYGELRRIINRYNGQVNGYFLCDRGRFGYDFVNSDRRIRVPELRERLSAPADPSAGADRSPGRQISDQEILDFFALSVRRGTGLIGVGSPRASLEANYALRNLVGADNFYSGMGDEEYQLVSTALDLLQNGPAPSPSLAEVRESDAVLVLGEDVPNTAPVLALALRQAALQQPMKGAMKRARIPRWDDGSLREAIQDKKGPFFAATAYATRLDELATEAYRLAPSDIARVGFAVAAAVSGDSSMIEGLTPAQRSQAEAIAQALLASDKPLVVSGTGAGSTDVLRAAAAVAWALRDAGKPCGLSFAVPECNSMGLAMMAPRPLSEAFDAVRSGAAGTVIVLENDLYRRTDAAAVDGFLDGASLLVVLDYLTSATSDRADLLLPVGTFAESDGSFVSQEGRAQRFYQVLTAREVLESWRWLRDLTVASGQIAPQAWTGLDDVIGAMVADLPRLAGVDKVAPPASFRVEGMKIARDSHRYSGRTAMNADVDVSEPKPPSDPDSPLSFTMEGYFGDMPSALIPRFWAPGWNSWQQSVNKFQQEVGGPLRGGDPGVRLIEPASGDARPSLGAAPASFERRAGEWLAVPVHHVFGSDEMSMLSLGVSQLSPRPYLSLNPEDGAALGLADGAELTIDLGGRARALAVRIDPTLPPGVAGVAAGLPETAGVVLPTWISLSGG